MFKIDRLKRIKLTKGDDAAFRVRLYNGKDQIDVATGTLTMSVRQTPESELLFSIEADEKGYFILSHELTEDATVGTYFYDIQWVDSNDNVSTVVKSDFTLTEEVTYAI